MATRLTTNTVAEEARTAVSKDGPKRVRPHGSRRPLRGLLTMRSKASAMTRRYSTSGRRLIETSRAVSPRLPAVALIVSA